MGNKTEHKKNVTQALAGYQQALDTRQVFASPFDPKRVYAISKTPQARTIPPIEIPYKDILAATKQLIPAEVNPAYARTGRIGHKLIAACLNHELVFPSDLDNESKITRLLEDPELATIDQNTQLYMFSDNRPTSRGTAQAVLGVISFFLTLGRKNPAFEQTVYIPVGEHNGRQVFIKTRGDSIDGRIGEETTVDNFKTGRGININPKRIHLDMYMQEITAQAIKCGIRSPRRIWRNDHEILEDAILGKLPIEKMACRRDPPGRIICSDGIIGDNIHFPDGGRLETKRLLQLVDQCIQKTTKIGDS